MEFNFPCDGYYIETGELRIPWARNNFNYDFISAPYIAEALEWIDEKHHLFGGIYVAAGGYGWTIDKSYYIDENKNLHLGGTFIADIDFTGDNEAGLYDTIQEAQLAILDALIRILERK